MVSGQRESREEEGKDRGVIESSSGDRGESRSAEGSEEDSRGEQSSWAGFRLHLEGRI